MNGLLSPDLAGRGWEQQTGRQLRLVERGSVGFERLKDLRPQRREVGAATRPLHAGDDLAPRDPPPNADEALVAVEVLPTRRERRAHAHRGREQQHYQREVLRPVLFGDGEEPGELVFAEQVRLVVRRQRVVLGQRPHPARGRIVGPVEDLTKDPQASVHGGGPVAGAHQVIAPLLHVTFGERRGPPRRGFQQPKSKGDEATVLAPRSWPSQRPRVPVGLTCTQAVQAQRLDGHARQALFQRPPLLVREARHQSDDVV